MTAIAIWCNTELPDQPSLWAAADSLVTRASGSPLIGDAAKIFSLPVICRCPSPDGLFSTLSSQHSYGYAFAGSTLIGQNAYLSLVPLLSNLITHTPYSPPFKEVAAYVLRYLRSSYDELKLTIGPDANFRISIFGWCPVHRVLSVYTFSPTTADTGQFQVSCTANEDMKHKAFVYLGDRSEHMTASIAAAFELSSIPGRPQTRAPRYVIEDHIAADDFETIGGDLQLGIANSFGFQHYMLCRPRILGRPEAYFSYLGRELVDDLTSLGSARIGLLASA
jgi:hypothetical protein